MVRGPGPEQSHGHARGGHRHEVGATADRRLLVLALGVLVAFTVVEVAVGLVARSSALLADAGHLLSDAGAIALALGASWLAGRPARGAYTYGLRRVEILAAQLNGLVLLGLAVVFVVEGVRRLLDPPEVRGGLVLGVALLGIAVNLLTAWLLSRADRRSLNVEGAFQHVLTDLYAFVGTAVAGLVVLVTGFQRADAIATIVVAGLMVQAGLSLVRESGRVFLEASPRGTDPAEVLEVMRAEDGVVDVHELHVWEVTSALPALSAHVLVQPSLDCHAVRRRLEQRLGERFGIEHTTLQVDHGSAGGARPLPPVGRGASAD